MEPYRTTPENAAKIASWLKNRGGIKIWDSANLSNPSATWTMPFLTEDGKDSPKPTWEAGSVIRVITDIAEVEVAIPKEYKRFRIAIRQTGVFGMTWKLTDFASAKVHRIVAEAQEKHGDAWYEFDYDQQQAVVLVADKVIPLAEFKE